MLKDKHAFFEDLSLLVLDEVHHAVKEHTYSLTLQQLHEDFVQCPERKPKILGLTASPGASDDIYDTICDFNMLTKLTTANIRIPTAARESLDKIVHQPQVDILELDFSEAERNLIKLLGEFLAQFLGHIVPEIANDFIMIRYEKDLLLNLLKGSLQQDQAAVVAQVYNVRDELLGFGLSDCMESLQVMQSSSSRSVDIS